MVYDPQANRRRPQPDQSGPAPIDALLGNSVRPTSPAGAGVRDDPPPTPAVTPAPADPPSDTLLLKTVLAVVAGGLVALLVLRHLSNRRR